MEKRYRKMARKVNGKIREVRDGHVVLEIPLPLAEVIGNIPAAVREMCEDAGLMVVSALLEDECKRIAGLKGTDNIGSCSAYLY